MIAVASGRHEPLLRTLRRGSAPFPIVPLGYTGADDAAARSFTVSTTQVCSSGRKLAQLAFLPDTRAVHIHIHIDSVFPLADARQAHERAAAGHVAGKIVLQVR